MPALLNSREAVDIFQELRITHAVLGTIADFATRNAILRHIVQGIVNPINPVISVVPPMGLLSSTVGVTGGDLVRFDSTIITRLASQPACLILRK